MKLQVILLAFTFFVALTFCVSVAAEDTSNGGDPGGTAADSSAISADKSAVSETLYSNAGSRHALPTNSDSNTESVQEDAATLVTEASDTYYKTESSLLEEETQDFESESGITEEENDKYIPETPQENLEFENPKEDTQANEDVNVDQTEKEILSSDFNVPTIDSITDPIISGVVLDYRTKSGISDATVTIESEGNLLANTTTKEDGSYSIGFISDDILFKITATVPGYVPSTKEVTVSSNPNDPTDPNLYGTAVFQLGKVGIPQITIISGSTDKVAEVLELENPLVYAPLDYNNANNDKIASSKFIMLEMLSDISKYKAAVDEAKANGAKVAQFSCVGEDMTNIDVKTQTYVASYWKLGGSENIKNMINYVQKELLGEDKTYKTPSITIESSPCGIYHPEKTFIAIPDENQVSEWINSNPGFDYYGSPLWLSDYAGWAQNQLHSLVSEYEAWYSYKAPWIGIITYSPGPVVDAMICEIESCGEGAIALFSGGGKPPATELLKSAKEKIGATISLWSFYLKYPLPEEGIKTLSEVDVETIKAVTLYGQSMEEYQDNFYGPQFEWVWQVVTPEIEGIFSPVLVSAKSKDKMRDVPIEEGIKKTVDLAIKWSILKEKENHDKKIALILYNYPPGKADIGASYLNVFQSVHDLLVKLKENEYNLPDSIPSPEELYNIISEGGNKGIWAQPLLEKYVGEHGEILEENGQLVDLDKYLSWFDALPDDLKKQVIEKWGDPPGNIMVCDNKIVIPGITLGNIFLTLQPSRGWEDVSNYHDPYLPPHHQYIAFYNWLENEFGADAMVHVGTHGTLEWLPGRKLGLLSDDWPFILNTLPNIYPYIVSNPGEGLVAKYRANALIISHMTPAMVQSGLYGDLANLESLINQYEDAERLGAAQLIPNLEKSVTEVAEKLGYAREDLEFGEWIDQIHDSLLEIKNDWIPFGLHTLGEGLTGDSLVEETLTIASSRTNLLEDIAASRGLNYNALIENPTLYNDQLEMYGWQIIESIKNEAKNYISELAKGKNPDELTSESNLIDDLKVCKDTISKLVKNEELESILKALDGRYVKPGLAGDPAYYDETLPTGKNFYSGDPSKMPTKAAWETGKQIADKLIQDYYMKNGRYPDTVGVVVWGTEVLRTNGVSLSTILALMGTKPVWNKYNKVIDAELIPLSELGRPRIDVVVTVAMHYKGWIDLINKAVKKAAEADESLGDNYVKSHYAEHASLNRVFGHPPNVLAGTGVCDLVPNTEKWNAPEELASVYLSRMSNAYGDTIQRDEDTFKYLLGNLDIATQPIDSTWRLLDTDDYYDWLGGMILTSKSLGANPEGIVADIRNPKKVVTRSIQDEVELEIRSQLLNPLYMNSLLQTPSGWIEYAKRYENLFGMHTTTGCVSNEMWTQVSQNLAGLEISKNYEAFAMQSMIGWILEAARRGMWQPSPELLNALTTKYVDTTVKYGVTCCHHTCANILFNQWIVQMSSLSPIKLQEFLDVLKDATGRSVVAPTTSTPGVSGITVPTSPTPEQTTSTPTTPGISPGQSSAPTTSAPGASITPTQSGQDVSIAEVQEAGQKPSEEKGKKVYEVTKISKPTSSAGGVPIWALLGVILLTGLAIFGYFKGSILGFILRR